MSAADLVPTCEKHGCLTPPSYALQVGALHRFACPAHLAWQVRRMIRPGSHVEVRLAEEKTR